MGEADGVILVSNPKSGTHLISALLADMGFEVWGEGGRSIAPSTTNAHWAGRLGKLDELCNADGSIWRKQPKASIGPPPWTNSGVLSLHRLRLDKVDGALYRTWNEHNEPRMVYNFRHPKAALCSYVHWVTDKDTGMAPTPTQLAHRAILRARTDWNDKLVTAIRDPALSMMQFYSEHTWLLQHPRVFNVRYEDLVGEQGEGSELAQRDVVRRLAEHLGIGEAKAASALYGKGLTFRQGIVDGWRDKFSDEAHEEFNKRYGNLLEMYGYD